ncbi:MAG: hypothetical protein WEA31_06570 [Pirellulales bacterium]
MDKIKPILAGLLKYHFWVLLGIVVVIALFTWNSAIGRLDEDFASNKSKIDSQFSKVDVLADQMVQVQVEPGRTETRFANKKWEDDTRKKAEVLKSDVIKAWETVYRKQRQARQWPEITPDVSGEAFGLAVENNPADTPIPEEIVEPVKEVIAQQVEELPSLVSAAPIPEYDSRGKPPRKTEADPMAAIMSDTGGVRWEAANFHEIKTRFAPPKTLTTGWAKLAQEDLWVYQMLLGAIETCNGDKGSRDEYNLPINRIHFIDLGIDVARAMDVGSKVKPFDDPNYEARVAGQGSSPAFNRPEETDPAEKKEPEVKKTYGRYYEGDLSPVGFDSLPIRLSVEMRLEKLSQLMFELAEAELTTEIVDLYIHDGRGLGDNPHVANERRTPLSGGASYGNEFSGRPGTGAVVAELGDLRPRNPTVEIWALVHFAQQPTPKALMSEEELAAEAEKEKAAAKEKAEQEKADKKKADDE